MQVSLGLGAHGGDHLRVRVPDVGDAHAAEEIEPRAAAVVPHRSAGGAGDDQSHRAIRGLGHVAEEKGAQVVAHGVTSICGGPERPRSVPSAGR